MKFCKDWEKCLFSNAQFSRSNYNAYEKQGNMAHLKEHNKSLKLDPKEIQSSDWRKTSKQSS